MSSEYLLKYTMDYSLRSSSRSPLEYIQHQIIWWIHDNWTNVDNGKKATFLFFLTKLIFFYVVAYNLTRESCAGHAKVASCILEMWYNYHSSLWTYCSGSPKVSLDEPHNSYLTIRSDILIQPWCFPYMICFISVSILSHTWWFLWPGTSDKNGRHQYYYVCQNVYFLWECSVWWVLHRAWSAPHLVAITGNWLTWCLSLLVKTMTQAFITLSAANRIYVRWIILRIVLCSKLHLETCGKVFLVWEISLLVCTPPLIPSLSR